MRGNLAITLISGAALIAALTTVLTGCGSGNEPLSVLGDPNASLAGTLAVPYASTTGTAITLSNLTPFTASTATADGFDFLYNLAGTYQVLAPMTGIVTSVDSASLTILHNVHVSSRLSRLSTPPNVRVGDYVNAQTVVGSTAITSSNFNLVHLTVLLDGVATCPYGYLTDDFKTVVNRALHDFSGGLLPCNK
jgi:hypothetical protein